RRKPGYLVQDQSQDEFSFKGVAPSDRPMTEPETTDSQGGVGASGPAPYPSAPLPAGPFPGAPAAEGAQAEVLQADLASVMAVVGEVAASAAADLPPAVGPLASAALPGPVFPSGSDPLSGSVAGPVPGPVSYLAATSAPMGVPGEEAQACEASLPEGHSGLHSVLDGGVEGPAQASAPAADSELNSVGAEAQKRTRVNIEVQGEGPSSAKTVSPRHLVQGWLANMVESKASDLILRSGGRPSKRQDGKISFLPGRVPGPGPMLEVLQGILGDKRMEQFEEVGAADAALDLDGLGRFRINAYKQMGEPAIVIRRINENAPSLDELHLPSDALKDLALKKRGLVLVTGVAGSGKSTTLSAMIEFMNRNVERHIVTLEDPVELMFKERYCVISQREVGTDTTSFKQGIKHALRQSPDVIFIGEMRDAETVLAALEAIETGHLVMSTMHTVNAAQTVDRILGFFPVERHVQIRQRMADTLAGVLSMRLVPRIGGGQVPAFELMQVTPQVRELLEEGKTTELGRVIQGGMEKGIVSFNDRLFELVQTGFVSMEDAVQTSDRPDELIMMIRGIQGGQRATAKAQKQGLADASDSTGSPLRRRTDQEAQGGGPPGTSETPGQPPQGGPDPPGGSNLRLRGSGSY
ncbi:MAG: twitching motility protein PilT, partial [Planctomycetota bacterium]